MLWLFLENETDILSGHHRVLHFAPEQSLSGRLDALPNLDYVTGELRPGAAAEEIDITDIQKPDASFDIVLLSHVLEHVPDDRSAMSEVLRVLRPGGRAFLQHPVDYTRDTYEDWSITSRQDRLRAFGKSDHVRVYGCDLLDRLRRVGFEVECRRYREELSAADRRRFRVDSGTATYRSDEVYVCRRPAVPRNLLV